jgi:hypothetical protein
LVTGFRIETASIVCRTRATESDHRIPFRVGGRQASHEIRDPGARGRDRDPGLARHAANPARNERGILFVPTYYGLDFRVDERIENRVNLGTGDSKNVGHTLGFKRTHHELGAGLLGLRRISNNFRRGLWRQ